MFTPRTITENGLEFYQRYYSCYRGSVLDNNDPKKLGRIKVSVPQIYGGQNYDYWAYPKAIGGKGWGVLALPKIGDPVYVEFEQGDVRRPLWSFSWWLENEGIESNDYPNDFIIHTTHKHRLEFNSKEVKLTHSNGVEIVLSAYGISVVRNNKKVSIGSLEGSSEPAVLGDKNATVHNDTIAMIEAILLEMTKMLTAFVPSNPASISAITAKLTQLQIQLQLNKNKVTLTNSKNVTVDG